MKNPITTISLAFLCLVSSQLLAQLPTTFTGASSSSWNDPGNWDNGIPGTSAGAAIIPVGLTVEIPSGELSSMSFGIDNLGTILVMGTLEVSFEPLNNYGSLVNSGNIIALLEGDLITQEGGTFLNEASGYISLGGLIQTDVSARFVNYGSSENLGTIECLEIIFNGTPYAGSVENGQLGSFENQGIVLGGSMTNDFNAYLNNSGSITDFLNFGTVNNEGSIDEISLNVGTFFNATNGLVQSTFGLNNLGVFYNCFGVYIGPAPIQNLFIEDNCQILDSCDGIDNDMDDSTDEDCGCLDPIACNYNSLALISNGTCEYGVGCTDPAACNFDLLANCDDGSCILPDGCTDPMACNYNSQSLCDDGSCGFITGCTQVFACNYNSSATCSDDSCEFLTCSGCTGQMACNYNPAATIEDDTCEYTSCAGCTYPDAINYSSSSVIDNGSCIYELVSACPGDFNNDGGINAADLLSFLGVFGDACD